MNVARMHVVYKVNRDYVSAVASLIVILADAVRQQEGANVLLAGASFVHVPDGLRAYLMEAPCV